MREFRPLEAQPGDVGGDSLDEFLIFLDWIGVVETQISTPAILPSDPEVQADALGMTDVKVTIGLRRKARDHAPRNAAGRLIGFDAGADEIPPGGGFFSLGISFFVHALLDTKCA